MGFIQKNSKIHPIRRQPSMEHSIKNVLVLGVGNILIKDEGVGVHVIRRILESGIKIPDNIELVDGGTAFHELVPLMMSRERIIIVDALKYDDTPGSIFRFPASFLKTSNPLRLTPCFDIRELVSQVKIIGYNPEVEIIGIVPRGY